jgi:alpha-beta hydrolase superfamily lysophospholipase
MTQLPIIRTIRDAEGVDSALYEWPVAKPRAVVQIVHGLGEHARRYDHLAEFLNRNGFAVYADDHRGHGETGLAQVASGQTKILGNLGPGGMNATFEAVHNVSSLIRKEHPGVPLVLLGHSWGSFISQKLVNRYSSEYDLLVLSGTTLTMPHTMRAFNFNAKWKSPTATGYEWLSRDPKVGEAFAADHRCFYADAAKVFGVGNSLKLYGTPAKVVREDLPILVLVGSDDPIGAERGAKALVDAYRKRAGVRDIELVVYHGARHEVYNETNNDEVYADLVAWLNEHLSD